MKNREEKHPSGANTMFGWSAQGGVLSVQLLPLNAAQDLSKQTVGCDGLLFPYPIVIGVFVGDAFDGISPYGVWSREHAVWTAKGPIALRKYVANDLLDINFWLNSGWQQVDIFNATQGDPAVVLERLSQLIPLPHLPSPIGLHWYEWDHYLFDTNYPSYFPAKPGFVEALATIKKAYNGQIKIAPYVNGRIFDIGGEAWKADKRWCIHSAQTGATQGGDIIRRIFVRLRRRAYAVDRVSLSCVPSTPYWPANNPFRRPLNSSLSPSTHSTSIKVGAAATQPCFDPSHGHSLGDGISWVEGNRALLDSISKAMGGPQGNASFLLTESNAEGVMSSVAVHLTLAATGTNAAGGSSRLLPLFPSIYGGLYVAMGSEFFTSDLIHNPDIYAAKLAWQMQSGIVMGWIGMGGTEMNPPMGFYDSFMQRNSNGTTFKYQPEMRWLQTLDAFRTLARPYVAEGRRSRELVFEYAPATTATEEQTFTEQRWANPHRNHLHTAMQPSSPNSQAHLRQDASSLALARVGRAASRAADGDDRAAAAAALSEGPQQHHRRSGKPGCSTCQGNAAFVNGFDWQHGEQRGSWQRSLLQHQVERQQRRRFLSEILPPGTKRPIEGKPIQPRTHTRGPCAVGPFLCVEQGS